MIVSFRHCRCCERERWHELEFAGDRLPGWARAGLAPVLALVAAWGGRWACGECGNLASDLAARARRPGGGEPDASLSIPTAPSVRRVPAPAGAAQEAPVPSQGSFTH